MFDIERKYNYKNGKSLDKNNEKIFNKNIIKNIFHKIQINEWTFSLFLFILSLTIVAVKVIVMYGNFLPTKTYDLVTTPSLTIIEKFNTYYYKNNLSNTTKEYKLTVITVIEFIFKFGWFIKAALSGISLMAFTWFIVYKDSRIPGVNPPSPFSPIKRKIRDENNRIQMNYLIGILNGILIFIYMCF